VLCLFHITRGWTWCLVPLGSPCPPHWSPHVHPTGVPMPVPLGSPFPSHWGLCIHSIGIPTSIPLGSLSPSHWVLFIHPTGAPISIPGGSPYPSHQTPHIHPTFLPAPQPRGCSPSWLRADGFGRRCEDSLLIFIPSSSSALLRRALTAAPTLRHHKHNWKTM